MTEPRPSSEAQAEARRTLVAHAVLAPFIAGAWLFSIGYEILIGRHLGPRAYGLFETLIGVLAVPSVIASGTQLLLARAATGRGRMERAWRTAWRAAVLVTAALAALAPLLAGLLRLPVTTLLYAAALAGLWTLLAAGRGAVQGRERYLALGASFLAENAGRFVATYGLLAFGAWGALWAIGLGGLLAFVPLVGASRADSGAATADEGASRTAGDLLLFVAGAALVQALPVVPLLALRTSLPATAYAALAAMALLGRGLGQIGGWLTQALYPRLVAARAGGGASLAATVRLAVVLALLVASGAAWFMPRVLALAFAGRYLAYLGLFRLFLFAVLPVALIPLWVTEALAARSARGLALLAAALPIEALCLVVFRPSGVAAALLAQAASVLAIAVYSADSRRRPRPLAPLPGA